MLNGIDTFIAYAELKSIAGVEGFNSFLDKRRDDGESFGYIHRQMRFCYMCMLTQSGWISKQVFVKVMGILAS